ncbi:hypothetical protein [Cryptosporangium sp. NPDC051539]|uniref:hypothetical protein n=1 Tax=Cryptosporangium sp. NPDC051539 TaxID=3363962 RepID=UPI0037B6EE3C
MSGVHGASVPGAYGTSTTGVGGAYGAPAGVPRSISASEVPDALRGPDAAPEQKKFLGISAPQVLAGAMAASTSAVAASYLGVAGTVVGAGLGSVIATVTTAVYQKSIQRSNKVLAKVVTTTVGGKTESLDGMLHAGRDSASVAPDPLLPDVAQVGRGLPDVHLAEAHPSNDETHLLGTVGSGPDATAVMPAVTPAYGTASVPAAGSTPPGAPPPERPDGRVYGGGVPWYSGLSWKRIAAASAAVFVLVMGVITTIEVIEGRTVAEAVRGKPGDGTTVGRIVGNDNKAPTSPTPTESETTSESPSPSGSPSDELSPSDETSESPSGEPSDTTAPPETGVPSDGAPEAPFPGQTQGDSVTSAPVVPEPMDGSVTTSPSPSPLG